MLQLVYIHEIATKHKIRYKIAQNQHCIHASGFRICTSDNLQNLRIFGDVCMKGVITSDGNIIDLDSDNGVQNLPPESLVMEKRSYGA